MSRRLFFKNLFSVGLAIGSPATFANSNSTAKAKVLQISPIAGFQYHQGEALWDQLYEGSVLDLIREPENKYDPRAVRIDFNGQKLGYLPRLDNAAVSQLIDRREQLEVVITKLQQSDNPWDRVEVEVRWLS